MGSSESLINHLSVHLKQRSDFLCRCVDGSIVYHHHGDNDDYGDNDNDNDGDEDDDDETLASPAAVTGAPPLIPSHTPVLIPDRDDDDDDDDGDDDDDEESNVNIPRFRSVTPIIAVA